MDDLEDFFVVGGTAFWLLPARLALFADRSVGRRDCDVAEEVVDRGILHGLRPNGAYIARQPLGGF